MSHKSLPFTPPQLRVTEVLGQTLQAPLCPSLAPQFYPGRESGWNLSPPVPAPNSILQKLYAKQVWMRRWGVPAYKAKILGPNSEGRDSLPEGAS